MLPLLPLKPHTNRKAAEAIATWATAMVLASFIVMFIAVIYIKLRNLVRRPPRHNLRRLLSDRLPQPDRAPPRQRRLLQQEKATPLDNSPGMQNLETFRNDPEKITKSIVVPREKTNRTALIQRTLQEKREQRELEKQRKEEAAANEARLAKEKRDARREEKETKKMERRRIISLANNDNNQSLAPQIGQINNKYAP